MISFHIKASHNPFCRVIPLWVKVIYTLFVGLLVPINWRQYGAVNFLWFSDIALLMGVPALWFESRLLISMMALAILLPELAWSIDFFVRLTTGRLGMGLSSYMFKASIPLFVRGLSLFHIALPLLLIWLLCQLGYDDCALLAQTIVAAVVLPLSYFFSDPKTNVNWVYGLGDKAQKKIPAPVFLFLMMLAFPVVIYLPTHLLLHNLAPVRAH